MKKLVLLLAVVFSVSMFSCKNANTEAAPADDAVVVEEVEEVVAPVDSAVVDSAAVVADSVAAAQ